VFTVNELSEDELEDDDDLRDNLSLDDDAFPATVGVGVVDLVVEVIF
jgi:hypothetical protein